MKLQCITWTGPKRLQRRLAIKEFPSSQDAFEFLNKQLHNDWKEYEGELTDGTYAYVGGKWQNVKSLDESILAHV
tara:strand:- start:2 stop:226 length:225 start_codon:yes stop_codon:yes gene_type:complete